MAECPCTISIKHPYGNHPSVRLDVPCGKCPICLQNKRCQWTFRLNEELRDHGKADFLTLTYSDEYIPFNDSLEKTDLQKFHKRLRKANIQKLRYYAVGEYGTLGKRPHYHGIYFGLSQKTLDNIEAIWAMGEVHLGQGSPASIHYVTKYVIQNYDHEGETTQKPFALMSTKPALGHTYLERQGENHATNKNTYVVLNGKVMNMPRYYKDKIFTDSEKQKFTEETQLRKDNAWIKDYDKEWRKKEIDYIENQFRIINKQSKST